MAKAIRRSTEPFVYVLERDRNLPPNEQSRFTLKPLTTAERFELLDTVVTTIIHPDGRREIVDHTWRRAREQLKSHLVSVENFPAEDPRSWPSDGTDTDRERYLDRLEDSDILEIYNEIFRRSFKGEDDAPPAQPAAA